MTPLFGPAAAFAASVTWAFASAQYARASREVGSVRVNFARVRTVLPIYVVAGLLLPWLRGQPLAEGFTPGRNAWLFLSVVSSYALADSLFFTAARRVGYTTALSIGCVYPLWAALWGVAIDGEPFGPARAVGTLLCVSGVVALVRMAGKAQRDALGAQPATGRSGDGVGLLLAFVTSLLWAANSVSVKRGSVGLDIWQANVIRYSMALVLLAPQLWFGAARRSPAAPTGGWWPLLPAIIADAFLGSLFYVYGLTHTDLAVGSTLSSLAPLISVPIALVMGEERWNARRFAAIVATVAGIAVLVSSARG